MIKILYPFRILYQFITPFWLRPRKSQKLSKMRATNDNNGSSHENEVEILDIRVNKAGLESSLMDDIVAGLKKEAGEKTLPTLLLYDDLGLKLFEEITYLDEYYLTNTEIGILEKYAENMAERIEDGGVVIELGSG